MSPGLAPTSRGIISNFIRHRTAANLLMIAMLIGGAVGLIKMNTQFFPEFGLDLVVVSVTWPGAGAEDVDSNIIQVLEPEVRFLSGVDKVRSVALEGRARISLEYLPGTNMQTALSDVESAVGRVTTLPEESETPVITKVDRYDSVIRLLVTGPFSEATLKTYAKRIRDDLLNLGVDKIDLFGTRDEEILVEVPPQTARRLELSLRDIASRIAAASQDLPSGETKGGSELQIRSLGMLKTAEAMKDIEIKSLNNGQKVLLGDIATLSESFDDTQPQGYADDQAAIELHIQRSTTADALKVAGIVDSYFDRLIPTMPPTLKIQLFFDQAELIQSRIDLLLRNGGSGLILVLGVLFLFLNWRVGIWVALGIPISLIAALGVMYASGQTVNMISMFGLIMAIGIVVDDAIVVGEHAEFRRRAGLAPLEAAEKGAQRMAVPVLASSLTTIAAFIPLFVVGDVIGQLIVAIPMVMVAVILASLMECFLVLPTHMRHALGKSSDKRGRFRQWFDDGFGRFRDHLFPRIVHFCLRWRFATLASALAIFILCIGLVAGGRVGFQFFAGPEEDTIFADLQMVPGTPREVTRRAVTEIHRALLAVEAKSGGRFVAATFGRAGRAQGRGNPENIPGDGDNLGGMVVELIASDNRDMRTKDIVTAWRAEVRALPGVDRLAIVPAQSGPPGRDIDIRLTGPDLEALKAASNEVSALLRRYPGVDAVEDDLPYGKEELILELTPRGKALGFSTQTVGRQVRDVFDGVIARRFPRGDEEVTIRVRNPVDASDGQALDDFYLRNQNGVYVPLDSVVQRRTKSGFSRIKRENGRREIAIIAELDKSVATTADITRALERDGIADIANRYGLSYRYAGKAEEGEETFGDMLIGAIIGLSGIYIILAWVFSSYTRPLVVMSVIPLGFVGATIGHLIMGYDLTILSMVALLGLSGIVVNNSIILVSTITEYQNRGENQIEAIIDGTRDRLRAVILTSATTIGGLTPLMFETSRQAQFLIPMAVTLVFGLMVATLLVLIVVPCLLATKSGSLAVRETPAHGHP